jgi:hypothetical protein
MTSSAEHRITGATGLTLGIIVLCLRRFICILLSMFALVGYQSIPFFLRRTVTFAHYQCSILPALAFSLDMFEKTDQTYGVNEVLLASVLGAIVFSLFSAQPLVIVGVTGKETVSDHYGSN